MTQVQSGQPVELIWVELKDILLVFMIDLD